MASKKKIMNTLFDIEKIRSLGFYQPFGSLMLHGKIETRWVRVGKIPPFPFGKYLLYTTLQECNGLTLMDWCGSEIIDDICQTLRGEETSNLKGYAICTADLVAKSRMNAADEKMAFVKFKGIIKRKDESGVEHDYIQNLLYFNNVQRIQPFKFKGKQGVGIVPKEITDAIITEP